MIAPRGRIEIQEKGLIKVFLVVGLQGAADSPLLPDTDLSDLSQELELIRAQHAMRSSILSRRNTVASVEFYSSLGAGNGMSELTGMMCPFSNNSSS